MVEEAGVPGENPPILQSIKFECNFYVIHVLMSNPVITMGSTLNELPN